MFKKSLVAVVLVLLCVVLSVPAFAIDLQLDESPSASVVNGLVLESGDLNNSFSGGIFYGPVANLRTESGATIIGLGGVIGNLKSDENGTIKGAIGITAVTAFDNMIQASIVVDPADFKWLDADSYMLAVTVQPIEAVKKLGSGASALFGWVIP